MEINIQSTQGICSEFMEGGSKKRRDITIIIAPLTVTANDEQNRIAVKTGCNMWKSCQNEGCYYSLAARIKSKH